MSDLASSNSPTVTVTHSPTDPWLKDPRDPSRNVAVPCLDAVAWNRGRQGATLIVLDRPDPVVQYGVRQARTGKLGVTPADQATRDRVEVLLTALRPLLLTVPPAEAGWRGERVYFAVSGPDDDTSLGNAPIGARTLTFPVTEIRRPS